MIAIQLRHCYVSPRTDNIGFIKRCRKLLPKGIRLKCVRIDAAGYQHQVINYLIGHGIVHPTVLVNWVGMQNTTPSGFAAECRRDAITPVYLY